MPADLPPEPVLSYQTAEIPASFARDVVLAAFAADAHCLGPHWIYDLDEMNTLYPNGIPSLDKPRSEYHPGKTAGDLTHYGDQTLILLDTIAETKAWDRDTWMGNWLSFWQSEPTSYLDGATRDVLDAWEDEGQFIPSHSHDLAGASRMAPLLSLMADSPIEPVVDAVREQTASTHNDALVVDAAEFFARSIWHIRNGASYSGAFAAAAQVDYHSDLVALYHEALRHPNTSPQATALHFGQSCDVSKAFPLTIWLALQYPDNPYSLLETNALIGGDSSARGMLLGMLIAARAQYSDLPASWTKQQTHLPEILKSLQALLP